MANSEESIVITHPGSGKPWKIPRQIIDSRHNHVLTLTPSPYLLTSLSKDFRCNFCSKTGVDSYHCRLCQFDMHPSCTYFLLDDKNKPKGLPDSILDSRHPHPLVLSPTTYSNRGYRCNICGLMGSGFCYRCPDCSFDAHINCAKADPAAPATCPSRSPSASHFLTLSLASVSAPKPSAGDFASHFSEAAKAKSDAVVEFEFEHLTTKVKLKIPNPVLDSRHPHVLVLGTLETPAYCFHCTGRVGQGMICRICDFALHKECALRDPASPPKISCNTLRHPKHPHDLVLKPVDYKGKRFFCSECGEGGTGYSFVCRVNTCDIDVHISCMQKYFPQGVRWDGIHSGYFNANARVISVKHTSEPKTQFELPRTKEVVNLPRRVMDWHHEHELVLISSPYQGISLPANLTFTCDICQQQGRLSYHCALCKFDAHPQCLVLSATPPPNLPLKVRHPSHPHDLTLGPTTYASKYFICSDCGRAGSAHCYQCREPGCDTDVHITCLQRALNTQPGPTLIPMNPSSLPSHLQNSALKTQDGPPLIPMNPSSLPSHARNPSSPLKTNVASSIHQSPMSPLSAVMNNTLAQFFGIAAPPAAEDVRREKITVAPVTPQFNQDLCSTPFENLSQPPPPSNQPSQPPTASSQSQVSTPPLSRATSNVATSTPVSRASSTNSDDYVTVKIQYGEDTWKKKWRRDASVKDLMALVKEEAELPADAGVKLTYKDNEGDRLRIAKDDDWQTALEECGNIISIQATLLTSSNPPSLQGAKSSPQASSAAVPSSVIGTAKKPLASSGGWGLLNNSFGSTIINNRYIPVTDSNGDATTLGIGGFGTVFLCKDSKDNDREVAVKVTRRTSDDDANTALEEAMKLKELRHPHIVQCFSAFLIFQPQLQVCCVLEYCSEKDLTDYIRRMRFDEVPSVLQVRVTMMRQLAMAISYLHDTMRMLHRDIKAQNVLVQPGPLLKLTDFGLAKDLGTTSHAQSMVGTPYYMSPEIKDYLPYGRESDIFSLGVLYFVLLSVDETVFTQLPPPSIPAVLITSSPPAPNIFYDTVSNILTKAGATKFVKFIRRMLDITPNLRPSIQEICSELGL